MGALSFLYYFISPLLINASGTNRFLPFMFN